MQRRSRERALRCHGESDAVRRRLRGQLLLQLARARWASARGTLNSSLELVYDDTYYASTRAAACAAFVHTPRSARRRWMRSKCTLIVPPVVALVSLLSPGYKSISGCSKRGRPPVHRAVAPLTMEVEGRHITILISNAPGAVGTWQKP